MPSNQPHCSVNYHQFNGADLETFAHGVSTGIYTHNPPFSAPPVPVQADFDAVTEVLHNAYEAYKNGGKSQKGAYMTARANLISQLDLTGEYVDELPGVVVDEALITLAGYTPTKTSDSSAVIPETPFDIELTHGVTGTIAAQCGAVHGAIFFGCIMMAGGELPAGIGINNAGQLIINPDGSGPESPTAGALLAIVDLTKGRKKYFTGLSKGVEYFFYFYAGNSAGVSQLSEVRSLMCG